ncbi:MAG: sensor histidine kinase [Gammaproteobacteria bacterium]|nr:sensor histidine kinase [Gammaproteobacteria bacterium]
MSWHRIFHWHFFGLNQLILVVALVVGLGLATVLLQLTELQHFEALDRFGNERLELYASTVQSAHSRFDYLPFILSGDQQVMALMNETGPVDGVNRKLEIWQKESHASELYIMDRRGIVLASSNWQFPDSFIGNDYHFRPYFRDAMAGAQGRFFAVGVTTGRPGLFLSRPIVHRGDILGVAVVKIDMTQLEKDWASGGENVWVVDGDGVIFLASNPDWKYRSLDGLTETTRSRLKTERKYSTEIISPLPLTALNDSPQGRKIIQIAGTSPGKTTQRYMMHRRPIDDLGWTLYYLTDLQELHENRRNVLIVSALIAALVALLGLILVSRIKNRQLLEKRVASRTEALNESNRRLLDEINERTKAEEQLRQTHEGLIQAEKLAALGQLSAGLVHEISQPMSAMQTFIASTRLFVQRKDTDSALDNLIDIDSMARRVTAIVSHLKTFSRKSQGQTTFIALNTVIENALLVMSPRISKSGTTLHWAPTSTPVYVEADEIKLEQIIVNLIGNALDAMGTTAPDNQGQLEIVLEKTDGRICVYIKDNGCGISPDNLPRIFDPFFTTKHQGEGLGLGLSISHGIARDFGGDLEAFDRPEGGTLFKLSLDAMKAAGATDDQ